MIILSLIAETCSAKSQNFDLNFKLQRDLLIFLPDIRAIIRQSNDFFLFFIVALFKEKISCPFQSQRGAFRTNLPKIDIII